MIFLSLRNFGPIFLFSLLILVKLASIRFKAVLNSFSPIEVGTFLPFVLVAIRNPFCFAKTMCYEFYGILTRLKHP